MRIWRVLLVLWLILFGLLAISNFQFQQSGFIMGALAIAAGVFLAIDK